MGDETREQQIERLREAVRRRIAAATLRGAAREVGMSPGGLQKFADGATPYAPTMEKLRAWYGDDDAARRRAERIAGFLGLIPEPRRTAAVPIVNVLLGQRMLAGADAEAAQETGLEALLLTLPTGRRRAVRVLVETALGRGAAVPQRERSPRTTDAAVLAVLLEALAVHLPVEAVVRVYGRDARGADLVEALKRYVEAVRV